MNSNKTDIEKEGEVIAHINPPMCYMRHVLRDEKLCKDCEKYLSNHLKNDN